MQTYKIIHGIDKVDKGLFQPATIQQLRGLWIELDIFIHTTISTYNKLYKMTIILLQTFQCCVGGHPNRKLCCDP